MASAAAKHGGPFRWTDPDFLMTGGAGCDTFTPGTQCPGMTDTEYRTEFSLWAVAAASMLVAVRPKPPFQAREKPSGRAHDSLSVGAADRREGAEPAAEGGAPEQGNPRHPSRPEPNAGRGGLPRAGAAPQRGLAPAVGVGRRGRGPLQRRQQERQPDPPLRRPWAGAGRAVAVQPPRSLGARGGWAARWGVHARGARARHRGAAAALLATTSSPATGTGAAAATTGAVATAGAGCGRVGADRHLAQIACLRRHRSPQRWCTSEHAPLAALRFHTDSAVLQVAGRRGCCSTTRSRSAARSSTPCSCQEGARRCRS